MFTDTLKPVSFPLILPEKKSKQALPGWAVFLWGVFIFIIVFFLVAFIGGSEGVMFYVLFCAGGLIVYLRIVLENSLNKPYEVKYLKTRNKIRLDESGIIVTIKNDRFEFLLNDMQDICIFYHGYARENYNDDAFTGTGLNNRITFKHKGTPLEFSFYLDNQTWVILFDRLLLNWSWQGISTTIFHKGERVYKLPL